MHFFESFFRFGFRSEFLQPSGTMQVSFRLLFTVERNLSLSNNSAVCSPSLLFSLLLFSPFFLVVASKPNACYNVLLLSFFVFSRLVIIADFSLSFKVGSDFKFEAVFLLFVVVVLRALCLQFYSYFYSSSSSWLSCETFVNAPNPHNQSNSNFFHRINAKRGLFTSLSTCTENTCTAGA